KNAKGRKMEFIVLTVILLLILIIYTVIDNNRVNVVKKDIYIKDLPDEFENYTILQMSDLHSKDFGKTLYNIVNGLKYDMIAFTGDTIEKKDLNMTSFKNLLNNIKNKELIIYVDGNNGPLAYNADTLEITKFGEEIKSLGCIVMNYNYCIQKGNSKIYLSNFEAVTKVLCYTDEKFEYEDKIRKMIMKDIFRGKTDVYINFETFSTEDIVVKLDEVLADAYFEKLNILKTKYGVDSTDALGLIAKFPDIISIEKAQEDETTIWATLEPALDQAIEKFIHMRTIEGENLEKDILNKAEYISGMVEKIENRSPIAVLYHKEKLEQRLNELLNDTKVDEQRLATEVAILADKGCVDEELTRLKSHMVQLKAIIEGEDLVGRKLDFLIQEMNREANTIASKSSDIDITKVTIELKSEIEKIREQIQNLE
ncbi:MAG: YicC/YloC family endoribonuclease, partial [Oscillospiraceae bacterium]